MSDKKIKLYLFLEVLAILITVLFICGCSIIQEPIQEQPRTIAEIKYIEDLEPLVVVEEESSEPEYLDELRQLDEIEDKKEWYLKYKELETEYPEIAEVDHIYDCFEEEDVNYLQRCVETECHGVSFEGKANVASVIINRMLNEKYPDTFKGVVTQPGQFAYSKTNITEDTILACEYAWLMRTQTDGCLNFHSNTKTDKFCGRDWVYSDDYHHFY